MTYQTLAPPATGVRRVSDNAFIPDDPQNRDWQAYQAWLKAGGVPNPAPPPPPPIVPQSVMMWQLQMVLTQEGQIAAVNAAVAKAAATDPVIAGLWASLALPITRTSVTLAGLATAVGLTSAQLDALFIAAAKVTL